MGGGYHGFARTGSFFITLHSIRTWPFMGMGAASREGCGKCPVVAHRLCRDMWIIEEGDDCDEGEAVVSAGGFFCHWLIFGS